MKYFIDTEFIEGFHKPLFGKRRHFIDLISIGIAAEDGREYYAISNEFNSKDAYEWGKENVITKLNSTIQVRNLVNTSLGKELILCSERPEICTKALKKIAEDVYSFVTYNYDFTHIRGQVPFKKTSIKEIPKIKPEFYGYYADYDWVLFCSLFGRMIDLPKGFPMHCIDLKQMFDEKALAMTSIEATKIHCSICTHDVYEYLESKSDKSYKIDVLEKHPNYPKQSKEHNALADANWNKQLYDFLQLI